MRRERNEVAQGQDAVTFSVPSDREVVVSRFLRAPRALVFAACTQPEHLAHWWGPQEFQNLIHEMDVRPGGTWRIVQLGPDGKQYPFHGEYREVVEPERVVHTQHFDVEPYSDGEWTVTMSFAEQDGGTLLTVHTLFDSRETAEQNLKMGMKRGQVESLERLAERLRAPSRGQDASPGRQIVAVRIVNAPRERVFDVWTDRDDLARWWGPRGFATETHSIDVREGGHWRFVMRGPDGTQYPNEISYLEVQRPERLVYRHLSDPGFIHEVTFDTFGDKTEVTVRMIFDSAVERERAVRAFGAADGLGQTLDRLADLLAAKR